MLFAVLDAMRIGVTCLALILTGLVLLAAPVRAAVPGFDSAYAGESAFLTNRAYSTHIQAEVAPGQLATFVYSFKVPLTVTSGIYRFHGDLAQATTGVQIHPEGYYQEATCACP